LIEGFTGVKAAKLSAVVSVLDLDWLHWICSDQFNPRIWELI